MGRRDRLQAAFSNLGQGLRWETVRCRFGYLASGSALRPRLAGWQVKARRSSCVNFQFFSPKATKSIGIGVGIGALTCAARRVRKSNRIESVHCRLLIAHDISCAKLRREKEEERSLIILFSSIGLRFFQPLRSPWFLPPFLPTWCTCVILKVSPVEQIEWPRLSKHNCCQPAKNRSNSFQARRTIRPLTESAPATATIWRPEFRFRRAN